MSFGLVIGISGHSFMHHWSCNSFLWQIHNCVSFVFRFHQILFGKSHLWNRTKTQTNFTFSLSRNNSVDHSTRTRHYIWSVTCLSVHWFVCSICLVWAADSTELHIIFVAYYSKRICSAKIMRMHETNNWRKKNTQKPYVTLVRYRIRVLLWNYSFPLGCAALLWAN